MLFFTTHKGSESAQPDRLNFYKSSGQVSLDPIFLLMSTVHKKYKSFWHEIFISLLRTKIL